MIRTTPWTRALSATLTCLLAAACGSDEGTDPVATAGTGGSMQQQQDSYETLKIATWFAAPGELEALQEIINDYQEEYPGATVEIVPVDIGPVGRNAAYHDGDENFDAVEWDVGYQMLPFLSHMTDVAVDLSTMPSVTNALQNADDAVKGALEVDGMIPAMPLAIDRLNGLTYNLSTMTDPPGTLQEYRDVCTAYVDGGKVGPKPYSTGSTNMGEDMRIHMILLLALLPADVIFQRDATPAEEFTEVLELLAYYRDNDCFDFVNDDNASGANWDEVAQSVIDGVASMSSQADWYRGYFVANGQTPGTDFDTRVPLDDVGAYIYTAEFLSANASSSKQAEISNFLGIAARLETQLAYSAIRGSLPGLKIDDPQSQIADPGTLAARIEFDETAADGRLGTMRPWISSGSKPGNYMNPFMKGEASIEETVQAYLCGDNAPYEGYDCQ